MGPVVDLHHAVVLAGRYPVLAGLDLQVQSGEILLLEGENGSGKTSLLRLLAGLLPLSDGSGSVLGFDLSKDRASLHRCVGLIGHGAGLYDQLSVAENVTFQVRAAHGDSARVASALERVGLSAKADLPAWKLSAGQRRRCSLAITIARAPELWLMDEPEAGLDEAGRRILISLLDELASLSIPVLLSSHDLATLRPHVHRSVKLAGGITISTQPGGRPWLKAEGATDVS